MAGALKWWAHLDSNQGPKDYEQLQEIKTYINQQVTRALVWCGSKCGSNFLIELLFGETNTSLSQASNLSDEPLSFN